MTLRKESGLAEMWHAEEADSHYLPNWARTTIVQAEDVEKGEGDLHCYRKIIAVAGAYHSIEDQLRHQSHARVGRRPLQEVRLKTSVCLPKKTIRFVVAFRIANIIFEKCRR